MNGNLTVAASPSHAPMTEKEREVGIAPEFRKSSDALSHARLPGPEVVPGSMLLPYGFI
jgi:hypothetical protein